VDLYDIADRYQAMFMLAGLLGLGYFFKLFEYLGLNKRMRVIWMTLFQSRADLVAYLASFMLLVLGFAFGGHLCFGFGSGGFHNLGASMSTLLRFPLGYFDYRGQLGVRPSLAPWFFVAFLVGTGEVGRSGEGSGMQ